MTKALSLCGLLLVGLSLDACGNTGRTVVTPPPSKPAVNPAAGKLRGRRYTVRLTGRNETPAGAATGAARAVVTISAARDNVCWAFTQLSGVPAPLYAHIHRGRARAAGPIVIPLGAGYKPTGCTGPIAPLLLVQIEAHPARYYINIHNREHLAGAIRAQL